MGSWDLYTFPPFYFWLQGLITTRLAGQFGASRAPSSENAIMHAAAFRLGGIGVKASTLILLVPCSTGTYCSLPLPENRDKLQWDPGIAISSYMYIWPEMRAANTFSDLQYQLQMSQIFSIWDQEF